MAKPEIESGSQTPSYSDSTQKKFLEMTQNLIVERSDVRCDGKLGRFPLHFREARSKFDQLMSFSSSPAIEDSKESQSLFNPPTVIDI
jgi:hypothetical protein